MCYPILALVTIASATGLTSAPARPHTVLWPKSLYAYSIVVPPGWSTQETTERTAFMVYPPDKSCAIVVSWVEFPEVPGRTTDSVAKKAAAGAKVEHFKAAGTSTISGIKGKAYSGRLQGDNSTWAIKFDRGSEVAADCDRGPIQSGGAGRKSHSGQLAPPLPRALR